MPSFTCLRRKLHRLETKAKRLQRTITIVRRKITRKEKQHARHR